MCPAGSEIIPGGQQLALGSIVVAIVALASAAVWQRRALSLLCPAAAALCSRLAGGRRRAAAAAAALAAEAQLRSKQLLRMQRLQRSWRDPSVTRLSEKEEEEEAEQQQQQQQQGQGQGQVGERQQKGEHSALQLPAAPSTPGSPLAPSSPGAQALPPSKGFSVRLSCRGLGLQLRHGSQAVVLEGVSATLHAGRTCAVMGASGSGKTSFLSTLCGKTGHFGRVSGHIAVAVASGNGTSSSASYSSIRHLVAFVPQEDIMPRELTVRENIEHAALSRLPSDMPRGAKLAVARSVMRLLGLEAISEVCIGDESERGISGGQRKRVNVALQLAADPSVLLLDEPTSGLDAQSALVVCNALRDIAKLQVAVVLVLHQPRYEIFQQFDDLLLLAAGRAIYVGPVAGALAYVQRAFAAEPPLHTNPADFLLDLATGAVAGISVQQLIQRWELEAAKQRSAALESDDEEEEEAEEEEEERGQQLQQQQQQEKPPSAALPTPAAPAQGCLAAVLRLGALRKKVAPTSAAAAAALPVHKPIGFLSLTVLLSARSLQRQARRPLIILTNLLLPMLAAAILAGLNIGTPMFSLSSAGHIRDRTIQYDANALLGLSLVSVGASVGVFKDDRAVFFREASELPVLMHSAAVFCSSALAMAPTSLAAVTAFTTIYHALSEPAASFLSYYVPFLGTYLAAAGFSYLVAILLPRSNVVVTACVVIFVNVILGGTFITLNEFKSKPVPMNLAPSVSYIRYALEALFAAELNCFVGSSAVLSVDLALYADSIYGFQLGQVAISRDTGILFGIAGALHLLGLLGLVLAERGKKL
jgi:ABC-type multidrug transport system ATPase subunit